MQKCQTFDGSNLSKVTFWCFSLSLWTIYLGCGICTQPFWEIVMGSFHYFRLNYQDQDQKTGVGKCLYVCGKSVWPWCGGTLPQHGHLGSTKLGTEEAVWSAGVGRVPGQCLFDIHSSWGRGWCWRTMGLGGDGQGNEARRAGGDEEGKDRDRL